MVRLGALRNMNEIILRSIRLAIMFDHTYINIYFLRIDIHTKQPDKIFLIIFRLFIL